MSDFLYGQAHVDRYRATDGEEGYHWRNDTTILLLYTKGRKTGEERIAPLIYRDIDGDPVIVASKGGHPDDPAWHTNMTAAGEAEVQIKADRFTVRPRIAEGEERERMWKLMTEVWPDYDEYQANTDREIPVVVLERA